jgi:hypothetical protein
MCFNFTNFVDGLNVASFLKNSKRTIWNSKKFKQKFLEVDNGLLYKCARNQCDILIFEKLKKIIYLN